jgi:hypothetical protein
MSNIPTIEMKDLNNTMITLDDAEKISGHTRLTIQKKFRENKIEAIAMLKTGKPGRPSRVFNRSDFNALYGISASPANSSSENVSSNQQNDQNRGVESEIASSSP